MTVQVQCPNLQCNRTSTVPDTHVGRTGRCKNCGTTFTLTATHDGDAASRDTAPTATPASTALPDTVGRFQVRERLGAGAFGTVYRAFDPQLERDVALKVPQATVLDSPKKIERFLREAKAAAQLRHPHIVPVFDAGHDGARHYIASAFIKGQTLSHAAQDGPLEWNRAAQIIRDLAEALNYAHEQGIVHRDVKPANVMLDAADRAHLMDFGLAHRDDFASKLTQDGAIMGTPAYMPPEQAAGKSGESPLPASDQYSLGVTLYELLTGELPFTGPPELVLFNLQRQEPPSPRKYRPDVPLDLETICLKAMAKRPKDRYVSCKALADDLRRWQENEPIKARRAGTVERLVRWCRREPRLAFTASVAVLAVVVALGVLAAATAVLWSMEQREREARLSAERASNDLKTALAEKERANAEAVAAQVESETQRRKAETALAERIKTEEALNREAEERRKADKERETANEALAESEKQLNLEKSMQGKSRQEQSAAKMAERRKVFLDSPLYDKAVRIAQNDRRVQDGLGAPVKGGDILDFLTMGPYAKTTGYFYVALSGTKGKGKVLVNFVRNGKDWQMEKTLQVWIGDKAEAIVVAVEQ